MTMSFRKLKWNTWVCALFLFDFLLVLIPIDIYYTGLPLKIFPDFKRLVDYVWSGALLDRVDDVEAIVKLPIDLDTVHHEPDIQSVKNVDPVGYAA